MYETPTRFQSPYGKTLGAKSRLWRGIKRKVLLSIFINTNMCFKTWSFKQDQNAIRFICTLKTLRVYNLYNAIYSLSLGIFCDQRRNQPTNLFILRKCFIIKFIHLCCTYSEWTSKYLRFMNKLGCWLRQCSSHFF